MLNIIFSAPIIQSRTLSEYHIRVDTHTGMPYQSWYIYIIYIYIYICISSLTSNKILKRPTVLQLHAPNKCRVLVPVNVGVHFFDGRRAPVAVCQGLKGCLCLTWLLICFRSLNWTKYLHTTVCNTLNRPCDWPHKPDPNPSLSLHATLTLL